MKATLIYLGIGIKGFGKKKLFPSDGELQWIQHGVASIAAYAKTKGYEVDLVDMRTLDSWEHFKNIITLKNSDVIGISVSYLDYRSALKAFEIIKTLNPKIVTVAGGIFTSMFPEELLKQDNINYVITGEGEITFTNLLDALKKGEPFPRMSKGIAPDLDSLPFIDRELFDYKGELNCSFAPRHSLPHITMIAGRGCPYNCSYCQPAERTVFGGHFRIRSVENVIQELKDLKSRYDFGSITWWDDTFTVSPVWIKKFCDAYEKEGFNAEMAACSRADIICRNEEVIKRLAEIGLNWFVIGFESGNQRILNLLQKGTTVEQNYKAAQICKKYKIKICATFMMGLPTETKEEVMDTIKMMRTIKPEVPTPFYFTPIPGTHIYDFCIKNGLLLRDDPFNIERTANFIPKIKWVDYKFLDTLRASVSPSLLSKIAKRLFDWIGR